jgi:hypothetical protein
MDDAIMTQTNGWSQYQKLVVDKLGDHDEKFTSIEDKLMKIQVDIATLKVKAGVWGGVAGLIPVVIAIVMFYATQTGGK